MDKMIQTEIGEWFYKGCFIVKSEHPNLLGKYGVHKNNATSDFVGRCNKLSEARILCENNQVFGVDSLTENERDFLLKLFETHHRNMLSRYEIKLANNLHKRKFLEKGRTDSRDGLIIFYTDSEIYKKILDKKVY